MSDLHGVVCFGMELCAGGVPGFGLALTARGYSINQDYRVTYNQKRVARMETELKRRPKVGRLVSKYREAYECDACGQVWYPNLMPGARHHSGYRWCPNGCLEDP